MSIYSDIGLNTSSSKNSTSSTSSSSKTGSDSLSQADFMKLLTTQLSYQDPTKPVDNVEMVSQMAQISSLSGITSLNNTLNTMSSSMTSSQALMASSLVGQTALVNSSSGYVTSGNTLSGIVPTEADGATDLTLSIVNSAGEVVRQYTSSGSVTGDIPFTWDGKDSNGTAVASGDYKVKANGLVKGVSQDLTPQLYGQVESVTLGNTTTPTTVALQGLGSYQLGQLLEISK
ncbi:flagellar hook capping FlgD N-terminal domain-containing protein [uncultured Tolumonas sp.]|uniref:flagellar hook capping FlgD N-terminal domain-containing protein n=1 Tax=uncultured Tolumonas sp. TaxID=263765 RepID=UPI00292F8047|nr:flagellar hook capping FlgD N-terminal domain-containing protein [uncultured Tolumonas sp.]